MFSTFWLPSERVPTQDRSGSSDIPLSTCLKYIPAETLQDILTKSPCLLRTLLHLFENEPSLACKLAALYHSLHVFDIHCPIRAALFVKRCTELGMTIHDSDARLFEELQEIYFSKEVLSGQHVDYKENECFPYERISHGVSSNTVSIVRSLRKPKRSFIMNEFITPNKERRRNYTANFWKEWDIVRNLQHPNIETSCGSLSTEDYGRYFFLYPTYDFTLSSYFENPPPISDSHINLLLKWMTDLTSALSYFHGLGGLHRQLEPKNIILRGDNIFLSGFNFYSNRPCRTTWYDAPEIRKDNYTRRSDVYSLGFVLVEILAQRHNVFPEIQKIPKPDYRDVVAYKHQHDSLQTSLGRLFERFQEPNGITLILNLVIWKMLNYDPKLRPATIRAFKSIIAATKLIPSSTPFAVDGGYPEVDNLPYPDTSERSCFARGKIFDLNLTSGEGPFVMKQIARDLEEDGEELIFDRKNMSWELLCRNGPLDAPLFPVKPRKTETRST
jgi:serine/threonine protein kinase